VKEKNFEEEFLRKYICKHILYYITANCVAQMT